MKSNLQEISTHLSVGRTGSDELFLEVRQFLSLVRWWWWERREEGETCWPPPELESYFPADDEGDFDALPVWSTYTKGLLFFVESSDSGSDLGTFSETTAVVSCCLSRGLLWCNLWRFGDQLLGGSVGLVVAVVDDVVDDSLLWGRVGFAAKQNINSR